MAHVIDMAGQGLDGMVGGGLVGAKCAASTDCTEGKTPICWRQSLFNQSGFLSTHGGYCSSSCTTDGDCGTGHCVNFGTQGHFCLANCSSPTDPCPSRASYACFLDGTCFPTDNLSCDPTMGDGSCATGIGPGGCQRAALGTGNKGFCVQQCDVGVGTCGPDQGGNPQHCIIDDERQNVDQNMVKYGDKWVGPMCFAKADPVMFPPIATGAECKATIMGMSFHFSDICVDGDECYVKGMSPAGMGFDAAGDNLCKQMCYLSATPQIDGGAVVPDGGTVAGACPGGTTCTDIFGLAAAPAPRRVGLCK